jgi:acetyltransferase-like isoleucine patch superfamily enzyme
MITKMKHFVGKIRTIIFGIKSQNAVYIGKKCSMKGGKNIHLGNDVTVRPYAQIWCGGGGTVNIEEGVEIGERCRISIANFCEIGQKVLLSPNVYITDCDHEYRNVNIPVIEQGIVVSDAVVFIGEGSYIGINSVIVGNVHIGRHCVIGANSVVTKDIPDYSIAVGVPAKVIKNYNIRTNQWESV